MAKIDPASKYVMTDEYIEGEALLKEYGETSSLDLDDEALASAVEKLGSIADKVGNIQSCVDVLTYRLTKSAATAEKLGVELESIITDALNALDDDDAMAEDMNWHNRLALYKFLGENGNLSDEMKDTLYSETVADGTTTTGYKVLTSGLELTGFVKNPQFYTFSSSSADTITTENTPGWETTEGYAHLRDGAGLYLTDASHWVVNSMINLYRGRYTVRQVLSNLPVGVYDIHMRTRTAPGKIAGLGSDSIPDMYIWASTAEGDTLRAAFEQGDTKYSQSEGFPTVIKNVEVKEGMVLSIGVKEAYTSGKSLNADGTDQGSWDTNTYADDVRLIFVAPLAGYDYAKAYADNIDGVKAAEAVSYEYYTLDGMKLERPMRGVNIVKIHRADGTTDVKKVVVK